MQQSLIKCGVIIIITIIYYREVMENKPNVRVKTKNKIKAVVPAERNVLEKKLKYKCLQ